eukprot:8456880-Pyramimonas_sp.AAC.2
MKSPPAALQSHTHRPGAQARRQALRCALRCVQRVDYPAKARLLRRHAGQAAAQVGVYMGSTGGLRGGLQGVHKPGDADWTPAQRQAEDGGGAGDAAHRARRMRGDADPRAAGDRQDAHQRGDCLPVDERAARRQGRPAPGEEIMRAPPNLR